MSFQDIIKIGNLTLKNRIVMAAMTRQRASLDGIPGELVAKYYAQRAGAGLLLTEALAVSNISNAFPGAGCLYNQTQAEAWKKTTHDVKKRDGVIFAQLYHCGRNASPVASGFPTIAPSAIAPRGNIWGKESYTVPKEMTIADIDKVKEQFLHAIKLAKVAGFDGVALHAANGYLLDSFIRSFSNHRNDIYGGSVENRCRLVLEVADLAIQEWRSNRVSIKLSPVGRYGDMFDEKPLETYRYLIRQLDKRKIGTIELVRAEGEFVQTDKIKPKIQMNDVLGALGKDYSGIIIGNGGYSGDSALRDIEASKADMISFGRLFISNPDLAQRIIHRWPINENYEMKTFYSGGSNGYTDYPFSTFNRFPYKDA